MALSDYIKGIVIFFMAFTGIFTFINLNASKYNLPTYENTLADKVMSDVRSFNDKLNEKIHNLQSSSGIVVVATFVDLVFTGIVEISKMSLSTLPNTILLIADYLSVELGLPSWVLVGVITIAFISMISYVIYLIFKVKF